MKRYHMERCTEILRLVLVFVLAMWQYNVARVVVCLALWNISTAKKNVLFIMVDDMRPELNCYSGIDAPSPQHPTIHSPNMDALAAKSLLLKRAYVQQALCSPSRASMLTGRRPDTTHVYNLDDFFRNVGGNFTTLPEHFKNNGYISAGMGKIFHPGEAGGHDDPQSWSLPYFRPKSYGWETKNYSWHAINDSRLVHKPLKDFQVAQQAKRTLKYFAKGGRYENRPFFVAVGFYKPHLPFVFPASFLDYYPKDKVPVPDNQYAPIGMPEVAWMKHQELTEYKNMEHFHDTGDINTTLPRYEVITLRRAYYSAVSWVDSMIGEVLNELKTLGLDQDTVISLVGDHGWQLGEHGLWCKHTNFEVAAHAPMMIRIPGKTDAGIQSRKVVEFVDLFPTIVDAAELDPIPLCPRSSNNVALCREGRSMLPLLNNTSDWKHAAFSQYPRHKHGKQIMGYSIRTEKYRYTEWVGFSGAPNYLPDWNQKYGVELYDHIKDPEENLNCESDPAYHTKRLQLQRMLHTGWRALSHEHSAPSIIG